MLTVSEIIQVAKVSQYLADDDASKGALFGSVIDPMLGIKLYVIRKDVEDIYNLDPTNADLVKTSNYLYGLCGSYALTAQAIISGGGGSVVPPVDPNKYIWYSFVGAVPVSGDGLNTYQNDLFKGATSLNTMTVNSGGLQTLPTDFTFDSGTGTITWGTNIFSTGDVIASQFYRLIS